MSWAVHSSQEIHKRKQAKEDSNNPEQDGHNSGVSRPPFRGWWRVEPRMPFADAGSPRVIAKGKTSSPNSQRQSAQPIYQRNQKLQFCRPQEIRSIHFLADEVPDAES